MSTTLLLVVAIWYLLGFGVICINWFGGFTLTCGFGIAYVTVCLDLHVVFPFVYFAGCLCFA